MPRHAASAPLAWIGGSLTQCETPHAGARNVATLDVRTPLLVPSFSSRGFPEVGAVFSEMADRLFGVCLISAWDIDQGHLSPDALLATNVVVLDSGGYEAQDQLIGNSASRHDSPVQLWSVPRLHQILNQADESANVLVVNFDRRTDIHGQLDGARLDQERAQGHAFDFLVKPESSDELVNVPRLATVTSDLGEFDAIGVTAREVGTSLTDRCRSIVLLRHILTDAGLSLPIHVFGAISPIEVLTYFFCGADIFDGLDWLRTAYRSKNTIPIDEAAYEEENWGVPDQELWLKESTNNLSVLYLLQQSMRSYAEHGSLEVLCLEFPAARRAARIAKICGAEVRTQGADDGR